MPWHLMRTTGGLRRRAPTEWQGAGECRRRSAAMWSRLRAGCALQTELEFDEGDAIYRLDQLAVWDLRRRLARAGRCAREVSSDGLWAERLGRDSCAETGVNQSKAGRAT